MTSVFGLKAGKIEGLDPLFAESSPDVLYFGFYFIARARIWLMRAVSGMLCSSSASLTLGSDTPAAATPTKARVELVRRPLESSLHFTGKTRPVHLEYYAMSIPGHHKTRPVRRASSPF